MKDSLQYMQELLSKGNLQKLSEALSNVTNWTKELYVLAVMFDVFCDEAENNVQDSVFDYSTNIDTLTKHFIQLKLYLRRLDFDLPVENQLEIYEYIQRTNTSDFLLTYYLKNNIFYPQKVAKKLSDIFLQKESRHSKRAIIFAKLAEQLPKQKEFS